MRETFPSYFVIDVSDCEKVKNLQRVVKEKNALAERLKSAEAARKRFDEELKRFATETVSGEELRQSLEDEVRRLTQTVGQTEGGLREKEHQVVRCEEYIDGLEAKQHACQVHSASFHTFEISSNLETLGMMGPGSIG